jgi:hypothetical protein
MEFNLSGLPDNAVQPDKWHLEFITKEGFKGSKKIMDLISSSAFECRFLTNTLGRSLNSTLLLALTGAHRSVEGWDTILQARRECVRVLMRSFNVLNFPNCSSRTMALGFTQPVTEMSTGRCLRGYNMVDAHCWQPSCHLCADCLENMGSSISHNLRSLCSPLQE